MRRVDRGGHEAERYNVADKVEAQLAQEYNWLYH
jgi:hypothetical protein